MRILTVSSAISPKGKMQGNQNETPSHKGVKLEPSKTEHLNIRLDEKL